MKTLVFLLSVACLTSELSAQTRTSGTVSVVPGTRVRVKTPSLVAPLIANFFEQRADTLVFIEDGTGRGLWSFPLSQIERLETTAGEVAGRNKQAIAKGTVIGAGIGLAAGIAFARLLEPSDSTREYNSILTGLVGAGIGAGGGAFFGSRAKTERWVNVPLPSQFSLRASRRRLAIAFAFR